MKTYTINLKAKCWQSILHEIIGALPKSIKLAKATKQKTPQQIVLAKKKRVESASKMTTAQENVVDLVLNFKIVVFHLL